MNILEENYRIWNVKHISFAKINQEKIQIKLKLNYFKSKESLHEFGKLSTNPYNITLFYILNNVHKTTFIYTIKV